MRLLKLTDGNFSLTPDYINFTEPYAILSHTWGDDNEEVTCKDMIERSGKTKPGYKKLEFCARQAARDGLGYFWVDTCCIDKPNSTELQEAIISMFRWYRNATICYVYLSDVSTDGEQAGLVSQSCHEAFHKSRWFTRGWTLQELIAPKSVEFFCSNGYLLGDKSSLEGQLHDITGIAISALQRGADLSVFSVEERMLWAENRQTQRGEDKAYSLFGIFNIFLPVMYGEGADNAFHRLYDEIEKKYPRKRPREDAAMDSQDNVRLPKRPKGGINHSSSIPPISEDSSCLDAEEVSHGIDAATKQSIVEQLFFVKIDERLTSLTAALGATCRWFLTSPEYTSWKDVAQRSKHGGFLWIKGNPGTGKSTLMKLIFEEAKLRAKDDPSQITLSFFFLARGEAEEKSTTGLYRSLLHQVFQKEADLTESLEWMTADGARGIQRTGWHKEALKQTLTRVVQNLGTRTLTLFIDALDECDINEVADMVGFFEELCDCARANEVRLQICFSSRHYPTVAIDKGIEIILEDQSGHREDIKQYIKSKLKLGKLKQAEQLRTEILEKSSGIFLWAVLVIPILSSGFTNGSITIKGIRERLLHVPSGLAELFEMILTRDGTNLEELEVCLKWILFAVRPLKPQELYFAVQFGVDKTCTGFWDQEDIELEQMKSFVRSSSKGLAEITRNKATEVQFIHESVRDFLLGKYQTQWSGASGNFVGHGHESLRDCCIASISQEMDIPDPLPQASKVAPLRETMQTECPFLEYSVSNVLYHANSAQVESVEQGDFLANFPLERWRPLNNFLEKYNARRYTDSVDLMYILAEKNLAELIQIHPLRETCFDAGVERYGPPILAALVAGSHRAVQTFLKIQFDLHPQETSLHDLYRQYSGNLTSKASRNFTYSKQKGLFNYLDMLDDGSITMCLCLFRGLDIESQDEKGCTPLLVAAGGGRKFVVDWLLEKGAELESRDRIRRTPLYTAADNGHEEVVRLLLEKGAEIESRDISGSTPLSMAAASRDEGVVRLLLEKGAKLDAKNIGGQTPLLNAVQNGREATAKLLLEKGADIEAKDNDGETPLLRAVLNESEAVVKLLLEKGAEVEAKDNNGKTPLFHAAMNTIESILLLLEKGAELEAKDNNGKTPLFHAVWNRNQAVVKLLLEKGAELEAKDNNGKTPLFPAVQTGKEAVVKLLLENGAELEAKDNEGRTPLSCAARSGSEAVVKLLLEKGAEVEAKDNDGHTPLTKAVGGNWRDSEGVGMIKLLLEKGADPDGGLGPTALSIVIEKGQKNAEKLLREFGAVEFR